ncbi:DNA-binding transcriptional regulator [Rhodococcus sp. Leaf7]|uniref:MocR-like transcription factor YczR n=1 Tax=unclassified Rhodococcus (in: high G+C Gram-positive bacteria) TaxID=192944 RepID=UPI0006F78442|nr:MULTISPECIES: PLP-dependent aminotransferase family protein [unclassified Rhodococcus (in: high G+C Gram-positive bacteria)]KQU07343.1 DNA-binding transcriptional regulator [Rhodococcus sp. Leaf7]KQU42862.1 DNA-binding transcriptional regulator [Rhodococcus sp. Leaf247]
MVSRVIGAATLVRDLGHWRPSGKHRPVYRALADGIRLLVHDGRIPLGVALPSERDLAGALTLSRTTVTNTYAALRDEGYLLSRQGSRSTVALPPATRRPSSGRAVSAGQPGPASVIDMTHAAVTAPSEEVTRAYTAALEALPAYYTGHGIEPVGIVALRRAIARRYDERGLPTSPDQIMVTSGAQQAWRLLLEVLVSPGDRVVVDHPTYPNALEAIRRTAARAVPVPLRPSGDSARRWDLDAIRDAASQTGARMAYVLPDFHNPTGALLDADGRAELASNARRTGTTLVVDESMADLWLDEAPPPPVASVGHPSTVVTVGSASKSYWGGLRVGWIRAAPSLISRLATSRAAVDIGTPIMDQLACAALIERHDEVVVPRRAELRRNRDALTAALADRLPDWTYDRAPGGLSLWLQMPTATSTALAAVAPSHGVAVAAGPRFGVEGAFERYVRLPYAENGDRLIAAVHRLETAYMSLEPTAENASSVVL